MDDYTKRRRIRHLQAAERTYALAVLKAEATAKRNAELENLLGRVEEPVAIQAFRFRALLKEVQETIAGLQS